ncbi:MAG: diguanylate cyclase [Anaerovoracaceae bacterium]
MQISKKLTNVFFVELGFAVFLLLYVYFLPLAPTIQDTYEIPDVSSFMMIFSPIMFILSLLAALAVGFFSIFDKSLQLAYNKMLFINFSLFIILASTWIFLETAVIYSFVSSRVTIRILSYFCFYLMPIPFLGFVRDICTHGGKIFNVLISLFILNFAINYIYMIYLDFVFPPFVIFVHVLIGISLAYFWIIAILEVFRYKNKEIYDLILGVFIFTVLISIGIIFYYIDEKNDYISFVATGVLLFIIILLFGTARRIISSFSSAKRFASIADSVPCGLLRTKNDEFMTITYANADFYRIYGFQSEAQAKEAGFLTALSALTEVQSKQVSELRNENFEKGLYTFEFETHETDINGNPLWLLNRLEYQPNTEEIFLSIIEITHRKNMEEKLRIQEEEYRIAAAQSNKYILRFDIEAKILYQHDSKAPIFGEKGSLENVPSSVMETGVIAPDSIPTAQKFYEAMLHGQKTGSVKLEMGGFINENYSWYQCDWTLIFDNEGNPQYGIISFYDISDTREKEMAYERIKQSYSNTPTEKISTFESNLTRDIIEKIEGDLLEKFDKTLSFNDYTLEQSKTVYFDDKQPLIELMNRERLLDDFENGINKHSFDYRSFQSEHSYRWVRLSVQLVRYPDSKDVKAFIITTDIDEEKRQEIAALQRSQHDPLTSALNRATFQEMSEHYLANDKNMQHAFIMLDIDNFKLINDTYGHVAGDRALSYFVASLKPLLKKNDMIGRIGGDEFMIFLHNVVWGDALDKRINLISKYIQSPQGIFAPLSVSIGVSMFPKDGTTFQIQYKNADLAMYHAKQNGKNQHRFYASEFDSLMYTPKNTPIDKSIV